MIRIGIFGAPVTRPLDFADAVVGGELESGTPESLELADCRLVTIDVRYRDDELQLCVAIPPRHGVQDAFARALDRCDCAVLLVSLGGWTDQQPVLEAFAAARRNLSRDVALVVVVNEHLPPRLAPDLPADGITSLFGPATTLRGRICWWRHEKTGTDVARAAMDAVLNASAS